MRRERGNESSRRAVLCGGLTVLATGLAAHAQAQAPQKLAQKVVQYQTQPKNGQMCSNCVNYEPPNGCKLVEGPIAPTGWCIAFGPKNG
jgi:hypothetical protein